MQNMNDERGVQNDGKGNRKVNKKKKKEKVRNE